MNTIHKAEAKTNDVFVPPFIPTFVSSVSLVSFVSLISFVSVIPTFVSFVTPFVSPLVPPFVPRIALMTFYHSPLLASLTKGAPFSLI